MLYFAGLGSGGRLGNQMFMFAALYAAAKRLGVPIGIDYEYTQKTNEFCRLQLEDGFKINLKGFPKSGFPKYQHHNKSPEFDPSVFNIQDGTNLYGSYQSPKYFEDCKDDIIQIYTFKQKYIEECQGYLKSLAAEHTTTLHVRRTDYIGNPGISEVSIPSIIAVVSRLPSESKVIVLSDDIPWCKLYLRKILPRESYFPSDHIKTDKFHDMCFMTQTNTNIIANSTFSWWGAYLNAKNSNVFIPSKWFKEESLSKEFYVNGWQKY